MVYKCLLDGYFFRWCPSNIPKSWDIYQPLIMINHHSNGLNLMWTDWASESSDPNGFRKIWPQWRRPNGFAPQPELVIHHGHPKAKDLHQLALALVVLVGPCEPRGLGAENAQTGTWMTCFGMVKSWGKSEENLRKIWGKSGENMVKSGKIWKMICEFWRFWPDLNFLSRFCPWFIILFDHSLSQIGFPVLFHNMAKNSSHAFVFLVVLAELRHLEFAMPLCPRFYCCASINSIFSQKLGWSPHEAFLLGCELPTNRCGFPVIYMG